MVRIEWTLQAKDDLKSIAEYISKDSKKYARHQVFRIRQKTKVLDLQPFIGRMVPEINKESIRELIEGNYRIIYQVLDEKRIDILAIHHSARDLGLRM